jgi:hypothetical protein
MSTTLSDDSEDAAELTRPSNVERSRKKKKKRRPQQHTTTVAVSEAGDDTATVRSDDEDDDEQEDSVTSGGTTKRAETSGGPKILTAAAPSIIRRHIIGLSSPIFWLTRLLVLPWLYHIFHHRSLSTLWLLMSLPLMIALVILDVALTILYLVVGWFIPMCLYVMATVVTVGCCCKIR